MTYPLLLVFALAPSCIWLAFYLRKDAHPEPNRMIVGIFLAGMLVAIPAIYIEQILKLFFTSLPISATLFTFLYFLFGIAFVEETLKYAVVRLGAYSKKVLDEPLDVMLYMVISALGFAASENILLLFKLAETYALSDVFLVNVVRFGEAIFLHALGSALFGYFLALSLIRKNNALWLFLAGLTAATALHGLFNFYIVTLGDKGIFQLLFPVIPLLLLGLLVSAAFRKLKKMKLP